MPSIIKSVFLKYLVSVAGIFIIFLTDSANGQKNIYIATVDSDGVQRIEVLAGEYFFDPGHIIVKANKPVEIKIKKEPSIVPHRFVMKVGETGIDIYEDIDTEPTIIKLPPLKAGKYLFYCDKKLLFFKSHMEQGMEGILEVNE